MSEGVIFCCAAADLQAAQRMGAYLETNLDLVCSYDEGVVRAGEDLLDAVGRGLSAENTVVVLSAASVLAKWDRARWQRVLVEEPREMGARIFFVQLGECRFPELLRRGDFADCSGGWMDGIRALRRFFIKRSQFALQPIDLQEVSGVRLSPADYTYGDAPQLLADTMDRAFALTLAWELRDGFEGVFWIDCAGRTPAGVVGETGRALGLRLTGTVETNRRAIGETCRRRRCLFVYDRLAVGDREMVSWGGRATVIFPIASEVPSPMSREETVGLFSRWTKDLAGCLRALGAAGYWLRKEPTDRRLADAVLAVLKHEGRVAEQREILEILLEAADLDGDARWHYEWERKWIAGHWGEGVVDAVAVGDQVQLGLFA